MVFITLPLTNHNYYNAGVAAVPQIDYVTINVAHIGAINDNGVRGIRTYIYVGQNSWEINMSKDRVLEEIKNAIRASLEPGTDFVAMQPATPTPDTQVQPMVAGQQTVNYLHFNAGGPIGGQTVTVAGGDGGTLTLEMLENAAHAAARVGGTVENW